MEKKIYRIRPVFEERMWGGQHLIEKYGYETELKNIAESYCCIAIPGHLDCDVIDTKDKLSDFYHDNPQLFGSETKDIPIRLTVESVLDNMSVQIHPQDEYALARYGQYGKPGGILYLEGEPVDLLLGHHAKTKDEFVRLNEERQFDKLFRFVDYVPGDFVHIPANTLHSFRIRGIMIAFARNSDVTLRLYDYDRLDPKTGAPRKMHVQEVYENITIPDHEVHTTRGEIVKSEHLVHTVYHDVPGEYTAGRVELTKKASFAMDEFYFMFCVNGGGTAEGLAFNKGDVLFVPQGYGEVRFAGTMDFVYCSYKNRGQG
ncbi:MAG: mannose-6-phosphate isomerase [Lachnospiraceae bacterium]|nr:mannose-6-phosphate isomerase [Lachnospiraceae bacterium]